MIAGLLLACLGGRMPPRQVQQRKKGHEAPGFSDDHVLFGQSAAFTGLAQELGKAMRLGVEAAFHEANQEGGVHGRELKLKALDDDDETDFAAANTQRLIENEKVFALIGAVGTPWLVRTASTTESKNLEACTKPPNGTYGEPQNHGRLLALDAVSIESLRRRLAPRCCLDSSTGNILFAKV